MEACRNREIPVHVVLPFPPERFLETSVRGARGGNWEGRFWAEWDATSAIHRTVLTFVAGNNPYAACNRHLVALAGEHYDGYAMISQ